MVFIVNEKQRVIVFHNDYLYPPRRLVGEY